MKSNISEIMGQFMQHKSSKAKEIEYLDETTIDKILEQLTVIDQRLLQIETGKSQIARGTEAVDILRKDVGALKSELSRVNQRAANMRIDRQAKLIVQRVFKGPPRTAVTKVAKAEPKSKADKARLQAAKVVTQNMTVKAQIALICGAYPGGMRDYGGEFIQRRAEAYLAAGLSIVVVEVSAGTKTLLRHNVHGVDVVRINPAGLGKLLRLSKIKKFALHSVEKPVWTLVKPYIDKASAVVWVHGFEARRWEELAFNFSEEDLKTLRPRLENANRDRMETMREVFTHPNVQTVFVSDYMRSVAEDFAGVPAPQSHVIHNSICAADFPYKSKTAEDRKHILWVRTFAAKNYANDISRDVILGLSEKPYFKELSFSIFGAGRYFDEITAPLRDFENVKITNRFLNREEMRTQHSLHGVKLVPSRWDSQGLTCGEAMHSGLVPLTSFVTGLKEFVDEDCAILAPRDGVQDLIEGYDRLYRNPDTFLKLSANAGLRSARQCSPKVTLKREIDILKKASKKL